MKRVLEMRGADGGPWSRLCALPALWTGLLYDAAALDAASTLIKDWTAAERERLRAEVPRTGLQTRFRGRTLDVLAREVLEIAAAGLARRQRRDAIGEDESLYLEPLRQIAESGRSPADDLLEAFRTRWDGSIDPVYREQAY